LGFRLNRRLGFCDRGNQFGVVEVGSAEVEVGGLDAGDDGGGKKGRD
jgi:hypothetical protein